jgi:hypothetical protein
VQCMMKAIITWPFLVSRKPIHQEPRPKCHMKKWGHISAICPFCMVRFEAHTIAWMPLLPHKMGRKPINRQSPNDSPWKVDDAVFPADFSGTNANLE